MGLKKTLALAAAIGLAAGMAWAQNSGGSAGGGASGGWGGDGTSALEEVCGLAEWLWDGLQPITWFAATISLVVLAIKPMLTGRFEGGKLIAFGAVCFFLAATPQVLAFVSGGDVVAVECGL
jgi:hypothetical protein